MECKTFVRNCEACKNCQSMFPKPVARSTVIPRPAAPVATRHVCEKHGDAHKHRLNTRSDAAELGRSSSPLKRRSGRTATCSTTASSSSQLEGEPSSSTNEDDTSSPSASPVELPCSQHVPANLEFESRLNTALASTDNLIAQAQAQLAACSTLQVEFGDYEPSSLQDEAWFNAEEPPKVDVDSAQLPTVRQSDTAAVQSVKKASSTADAGSQTDSLPALKVYVSAKAPAVSRASGKPASRNQKDQQGWHTLWSVDYTAKW